MLQNAAIREALEVADDQLPEGRNPFAKVNVLYTTICKKGGSSDRILLAVSMTPRTLELAN